MRVHGRGALLVVVRHVIDGLAGTKNVRLLQDTPLQRSPQPYQVAFVLAQREMEKGRSSLVHRFRPFGAGIF